MLIIRTSGDDALDTDLKLLDALYGFHVVINGSFVELMGTYEDSESGESQIKVQPLTPNGSKNGEPQFWSFHNAEIEVV